METLYGYSLAITNRNGITVPANLSYSPKYKALKLPIHNSLQHSLKELCIFTYSFPNSIALINHLIQTNGCINAAESNKLAQQRIDVVIVDCFGAEIADTLLFPENYLISSGDSPNKFDLNDPFLFFEGLIFAKFKNIKIKKNGGQSDYDYLSRLGKQILDILTRRSKNNPTPVLDDRIKAASDFLNILTLFDPKFTDEFGPPDIVPEALSLLLKKFFSTSKIEREDVKITLDDLDWEIVLEVLSYDNKVIPPEVRKAQYTAEWQQYNDKCRLRRALRTSSSSGRRTNNRRGQDPNGNWRP